MGVRVGSPPEELLSLISAWPWGSQSPVVPSWRAPRAASTGQVHDETWGSGRRPWETLPEAPFTTCPVLPSGPSSLIGKSGVDPDVALRIVSAPPSMHGF